MPVVFRGADSVDSKSGGKNATFRPASRINDRLVFLALRAHTEQNSTIVYQYREAMANRELGIFSVVELGEILRAVRKESGLTQRDAAALCNVSLPFLTVWSKESRQPRSGKYCPSAVGSVLRSGCDCQVKRHEQVDRLGRRYSGRNY